VWPWQLLILITLLKDLIRCGIQVRAALLLLMGRILVLTLMNSLC
jgi:hypothetical protein